MANLRGPGAMKGVNLIAVTYDNNVTKDGKTRYFDMMVDHRDERGKDQSNLHLTTQRRTDKDGKSQISNSSPYSAKSSDPDKPSQADLILAAGGGSEGVITTDKGAKVVALKGDLMPSSRPQGGLVLNTKTVEASDFPLDDKTLDNQYAAMKAAAVAAKEAKAAEAPQADGPEAEAPVADVAEAETAEAKADQPSFG